jgi:PST family polysaccharide transporter
VRGASHLAVRQGLGLALAVGGALALTRLLGPSAYGLYAIAYAITTFVVAIARMGIDAALIQRREEPDEPTLRAAFWSLIAIGGAVGFVAVLGAQVLGEPLGSAALRAPLAAMVALTPVCLLSVVPVAILERRLDYRAIARIELSGQGLYYALALPLAALGAGVWAPVAGYAGWQAWTGVAGCLAARFRPAWRWSPTDVRALLGYGAVYTASERVWMLRTLVAPVVVGRVLGPTAVGYVALSIRLCELLSFVRQSTARVAFASFARVQNDPERLRRGFERALRVQVLGLGAPLAAWLVVAPAVVPRLLGEQWAPMLDALPSIAFAYLVNVLFVMHSTLLLSLGENAAVLRFRVANVVLFGAATAVLVRNHGIAGYGWADALAVLAAVIVHRAAAARVPFRYGQALLWVLAFAPVLFVHQVPLPASLLLWLPLLAVLLSSQGRVALHESVETLREARR